MAVNERLGHFPIRNGQSEFENRCRMAKQTDSPNKDKAEETVDVRVDEELSAEELEDVSGGSGSGKRSAFNNAQQSWQATID